MVAIYGFVNCYFAILNYKNSINLNLNMLCNSLSDSKIQVENALNVNIYVEKYHLEILKQLL
jgi:hypothetical protein